MSVRLLSNLAYGVASAIFATLKLTLVGEEKIEEARSRYGGVILATWHGRSFLPINHYKKRGYWAFVSTSRDGEYQNRILGMYGYNRVRGSTSSRGAVAAALKMAKELKNGAVLAHTPDGPRGPSHAVHPGAIFLAEKSGCPILPAGISAHPRILINTWDEYMVPKPFARAAIVFGDPIVVPSGIDEPQREALCRRLGDEITRLEAEADMIVHTPQRECRAAETHPS